MKNDRRQPQGLTLADCSALILGSALALSLPSWHTSWGQPLYRLLEIISKLSLALIPLALLRCYRLGRTIRPAELLLVIVAAPLVVRVVHNMPWIAESFIQYATPSRNGGQSFSTQPGASFWYLPLIIWTIFTATVSVLLLARRLSPWRTTLLLVLAALSSYAWIIRPIREILAAWADRHPSLPMSTILTVYVIFRAITSLIPAAVGGMAVLDLIERRGRIGGLEWAGLSLATISFLAFVLNEFHDLHPWARLKAHLPEATALALGPLLAACFGLLLARSFRRLRNRRTIANQSRSSPRFLQPSGV